jgi:hypothetical protein
MSLGVNVFKVTMQYPGQASVVVKAGETVTDPVVAEGIAAAGGQLANANDPAIIAAQAVCLKMQGKYRGQDEDVSDKIMLAAFTASQQSALLQYEFTSSASASETEQAVFSLPGQGTITGAYFLPNAASTPASPDGTNNTVLLLNIYNAAGSLIGQLATATLENTNPMAQWVQFPLALTVANVAYEPGYTVTWQTTKTGTVTRPAGILYLVTD